MVLNDNWTLRKILDETRTIAVVGLSANISRPSYIVAKYMLERGYRIIPVNPAYTEVMGLRCYASLSDIREPVDMVNCFRKPSELMPVVESAIAIGAKTLWLQLGVVNEAAAEKARGAGLKVVMDRCLKIEYGRLLGGLN